MGKRSNKPRLSAAEKRLKLLDKRKRKEVPQPSKLPPLRLPTSYVSKSRVGGDLSRVDRELVAKNLRITRVWRNVDSAPLTGMDNVVSAYHGTSFTAVPRIAEASLRVEAAKRGAFGWGVYTTPSLRKALNYAAPTRGSRTI